MNADREIAIRSLRAEEIGELAQISGKAELRELLSYGRNAAQ
jgi:hypothetical protein